MKINKTGLGRTPQCCVLRQHVLAQEVESLTSSSTTFLSIEKSERKERAKVHPFKLFLLNIRWVETCLKKFKYRDVSLHQPSDVLLRTMVWYNKILYLINNVLCPIKDKSNTIELTVHASCYCVSTKSMLIIIRAFHYLPL